MKRIRVTLKELMDATNNDVADFFREKGIVPEKGYTMWLDPKTGDIIVEQEEDNGRVR